MRFTKEMIAEDEKRWHARDVLVELGYCSEYMRDRKDMTNNDIRFYAYIMRKAREMLIAQEPVKSVTPVIVNGEYECGSCLYELRPDADSYCPCCGRRIDWDGQT